MHVIIVSTYGVNCLGIFDMLGIVCVSFDVGYIIKYGICL